MRIERVWAMPSADTLSVPPIGAWVKRYLAKSTISVDPFARDCGLATYTNDLNPNTKAQSHQYAEDFLARLLDEGVKADLIIFDPPYSREQAKRTYDDYGKWEFKDTQNAIRWTKEKKLCNQLLCVGGVFLNFGWNTCGLGKKYNTEIEEILIVAHGARPDTLCTAERKLAGQDRLHEG